jgi:3-oxoacyl-[acyl-carrier protein] reductase
LIVNRIVNQEEALSQRRTAIVTGAAGAIGAASARMLASHGYFVVLVDRDPTVMDLAHSLGSRDDAIGLQIDLAVEQQIAGLADKVNERFGGIDVLVNNAGIHPKNNGRKFFLEEISLAQWQEVMFVNLTVPLLLYQHALPHMKKTGWGRVVNVASRAGRTASPLAAGHYSASKAGLIGLTRVMALESAAFGITANCVAPGPIATGMSKPNAESQAIARASIPMGRQGKPEDVASAIEYLVSEAAGFITGTIIDIAGGSYMP